MYEHFKVSYRVGFVIGVYEGVRKISGWCLYEASYLHIQCVCSRPIVCQARNNLKEMGDLEFNYYTIDCIGLVLSQDCAV